MTRSLFQEIAERTREQIVAELKEVQIARQQLDIREAFLNSALTLKDAEQIPDDAGHRDDTAAASGNRQSAPRRGGTIIESVLAVVNEHGEEWLSVDAIRKQLDALGVEHSGNNVRVALRRLTERGKIEKHGESPMYRRLRSDRRPLSFEGA